MSDYERRVAKLEARDECQEEKLDAVIEKIDVLADHVQTMHTGQDVILAKFEGFQKLCEERVMAANEVITDYKKTMANIDTKFHTVDREMMRQAYEMDELSWVKTFPKKLTVTAIIALLSSGLMFITSAWSDIVKFFR